MTPQPLDLQQLQDLLRGLTRPEALVGFLDVIAGATQVDERISHHLPRPVVGDLAAAVGLHHRDVARVEQVVLPAGQALGENRIMLTNP